ncbi:MAG: pilus assembly protein PilM [Armatimonadota bacterium]
MAVSVGIGVDITDDNIRVVRLRRGRRGAILEAAASVPCPKGAVVGGLVQNEQLLAAGLRQVFRLNQIKGAVVTASISGRAAVFRTLDLPAMQESEMRSVVASEMEHYRMIPAGQGTFDFLPLGKQDEGQRHGRVLVMAADGSIVDRYREALRLAGRQMTALEPAFAATCRAVYPEVGPGSVAILSVGSHAADLTILCQRAVCYLRQIDVGVHQLTGAPAPVAAAVEVEAMGDEHLGQIGANDGPAPAPGAEPMAAQASVETLAYELQRTLSFYLRETPGAEPVSEILLCVDPEQLPGLAKELGAALGLPVRLCRADSALAEAKGPAHVGTGGLNPAFAPAVGLALHALGGSEGVQNLDLSDTGTESRLARIAPRWLTFSLGISIILVFVAIATFLIVGQVVRTRQQRLDAAKAQLAEVTARQAELAAAAERAKEAVTLVELRGLPWSDILFQVSSFMPSGVWLTGLGTTGTSQLVLDGTALSANSVATLMDSLIQSPLFARPRVTRIAERKLGGREVVQYSIEVVVVPPVEPSAPPGVTAPSASSPAPAGRQP